MLLNAKRGLALTIFLLALVWFFKPAEWALYAFVKTFFEGTSLGKTLAFLGWMALYFFVLLLKEKGKVPGLLQDYSHPFRGFLFVVGLASMTGFFLHLLLLYLYVPNPTLADVPSIVGTMVSSGNALEWEASYMGHTHEGKIALTLLTGLLPGNLRVDSGLPLYSIIPFSWLFSLYLLGLLLLAAFFALQEGIASYRSDHNLRAMLWGVISYGAMVLMLDGNLFTVASQLLIGLFVFYYYRAHSMAFLNPVQQLVYPFFATGGILFVSSYLFGVTIGATYALSVLGFSLICLIAYTYKRALPGKGFWLVLLLFFGYHTFDVMVGNGFGHILQPGTQAEFFVYGLPEDAGERQIADLLAPLLDNVSVEKHSWSAFFRGTARELTAPKFIEQRLIEGLQPEGYLAVVYLNGAEFSARVRSRQSLAGLEGVQSEFVSFKALGGNAYAATGKLDPLFTNLFVLDFLRARDGAANAVVISR